MEGDADGITKDLDGILSDLTLFGEHVGIMTEWWRETWREGTTGKRWTRGKIG
jgi:hypothetical protein